MPYGVLGLAAAPLGLLNSGAAISIDVSGADAKIKLQIEILRWNGTRWKRVARPNPGSRIN